MVSSCHAADTPSQTQTQIQTQSQSLERSQRGLQEEHHHHQQHLQHQQQSLPIPAHIVAHIENDKEGMIESISSSRDESDAITADHDVSNAAGGKAIDNKSSSTGTGIGSGAGEPSSASTPLQKLKQHVRDGNIKPQGEHERQASSSSSSSSSSLFQRHTRTIVALLSWFKVRKADKMPAIKYTRRPSSATPLPQPSIQRSVSQTGDIVSEVKPHWHDDEECISEDERKSIHKLRVKRELHEYVQRMTDKELMVFLIARRMDVDNTVILIQRHFQLREEMKLMEPVKYTDIAPGLRHKAFTYWRDGVRISDDDRVVQYLVPGNLKWDNTFTVHELAAFLLYGYEYGIRNFPLSRFRLGFVYILDASNMHMINIPSRKDLSKLRSVMEDRFPMRIQHIYCVNTGWFVNMVMRLASLVLKQRIADRIHKVKVEELAHFVPLDAIPERLGGEWNVGDNETFNDWLKYIDTQDVLRKAGQKPKNLPLEQFSIEPKPSKEN